MTNHREQAIMAARAEMETMAAKLAETAETEFDALQRTMTECAMEFIKSPDEAPDADLLLQRIKKIKADSRNMYIMLNMIHSECVASGSREISSETWAKLCKILGKTTWT